MPDEPAPNGAAAAPAAPEYEPGTVPLRPVLIVFAVLLLVAAGFAVYSCTRSATSDGTFSDKVADYPPGSVTYLASGRTYLVRENDGSFLALSEVEAASADRQQGCIIRYRPDLSAAGQAGIFRDDCHGTLFNREGLAVRGDAPPMQQHPVQVEGSGMSVRFTSCRATTAGAAPEPCRE